MTGQTVSEPKFLNIDEVLANEELSEQIKIALLNQKFERERFEGTQVVAYDKRLVARCPSMEVLIKGWRRRLTVFTLGGDLSVCMG